MAGPASMRRPGFTMVELLVAGAIGLVVTTTALSFLVAMDRAHARRLRLAELRRTSARVMDQLVGELRQAGLGVPSGTSLEGQGAFAARRVVSGAAAAVGFLADLPRPDGTLNGHSRLADEQLLGMPASSIAILNELNGDCDVSVGAVSCETGLSTRLFPRAPGGCHVSAGDRTCPWGLSRYRAAERVWIADESGRWVERSISTGVHATATARRALELTPSAPPAALRSRSRGGFVSTIDRVFYRLNAGKLERQQCWDAIGAPTLAALGPCPGGAGTPWEVIADAPLGSTFTVSYFDATGAALAVPLAPTALPRVERVDLSLHLEQTFGDEVLSSDATQSVSFRQ